MWNYRLVRRTRQDGTRTYAIHEAYYDDAGRVWGITEEPVEVFGESWQEARRDLGAMAHAFRGPVLPWESVPEEGAEAPGREGPHRKRLTAGATLPSRRPWATRRSVRGIGGG